MAKPRPSSCTERLSVDPRRRTRELHFARVRVLAHVGQRFLGDAKELRFRPQRQPLHVRCLHAHLHARVGRERARQSGQRFHQRLAFQARLRAQLDHRAARFFEVFAGHRQRASETFPSLVRTGFETVHGALDIQRDSCQSLGQRVVDFARDARAFFSARQARGVLRQPCSFDGDANLIGNRRQQPQLVGCQLAPLRTGDVHDPERLVLKIERDTGVIAQPRGQRCRLPAKRRLEPTALHHVDIGWSQLAVSKSVDAPAATAARHAHALLQVRR